VTTIAIAQYDFLEKGARTGPRATWAGSVILTFAEARDD
jgi:hypothetical protein